MPLNPNLKKVMVIGSGPIVIGQAAEFDYAGTQACRALKEEGLEVVLVNSNPATIMTDAAMADHVYVEPLTLDFLKKIIKKEHPDSILSTLGGQTGLTLSMQLAKEGFLAQEGVTLLGANPETIAKAEDRQVFKSTMEAIREPIIPSVVTTTLEGALCRLSGYRAPRLHPRRHWRRHRCRRSTAAPNRFRRAPSFPDHADSGGKMYLRLERDRI